MHPENNMSIGRYAVIENGVVINVILWDGDAETWHPPAGASVNQLPDDSPVYAGFSFDGKQYTAPPQLPL